MIDSMYPLYILFNIKWLKQLSINDKIVALTSCNAMQTLTSFFHVTMAYKRMVIISGVSVFTRIYAMVIEIVKNSVMKTDCLS
jgi:hypothetical protein